MYALRLCDLRVEYQATIGAPLHVGGGNGPEASYAQRGRSGASKERGDEYRSATLCAPAQSGSPPDRGIVLPANVRRAEGGVEYYIPATALRGAFRHALTRRIDRAIGGLAVAPIWLRDVPRAEVQSDASRAAYGAWDEPAYWQSRFGSVLSRHLFGTEVRQGALTVVEPTLDLGDTAAARWSRVDARGIQTAPRSRVFTHNRLNRFTMASTEGLRSVAAIEVGSTFKGHFELANFGWWQLGAVALGLHLFDQGFARIGTRGAVGWGSVRFQITKVVARWHAALSVQAAGPYWGVAQCRAELAHRTPDLAGFWGESENRGTRMFVGDNEDFIAGCPPGVFDPGDGLDGRLAEWTRADAGLNALLSAAAGRLKAVAGQLVDSPVTESTSEAPRGGEVGS